MGAKASKKALPTTGRRAVAVPAVKSAAGKKSVPAAKYSQSGAPWWKVHLPG